MPCFIIVGKSVAYMSQFSSSLTLVFFFFLFGVDEVPASVEVREEVDFFLVCLLEGEDSF